jgi:LmbE family N-acetylglucosaminyl deacetylase
MKILVIVAHPDDPEFFAGGTLALWSSAGHHVRYVIVTGGDKGNDDPNRTVDQLIATREQEQARAAAKLGIFDMTFLRHKDGELFNTLELRRELVREIRAFKPERVVTTDHATMHYGARAINHNDHRVIGMCVSDAVFPAANNRMFFPELLGGGLEMHAPREIWYSGAVAPNTLVDITDHVEAKVASIREHSSQVKDPEGIGARMRQNTLRILADGSTRYMEGFRRVLL